MHPLEMALSNIIYLPSFMKVGKGVKVILRFCLSNLNVVMMVLLMEGIYETHH
jgi:hypothetical protein